MSDYIYVKCVINWLLIVQLVLIVLMQLSANCLLTINFLFLLKKKKWLTPNFWTIVYVVQHRCQRHFHFQVQFDLALSHISPLMLVSSFSWMTSQGHPSWLVGPTPWLSPSVWEHHPVVPMELVHKHPLFHSADLGYLEHICKTSAAHRLQTD